MQEPTLGNRYRIQKKLGEGGFGQTFLAEDLHLPTAPLCVVKRLKPEFPDEESFQIASRLFHQESEILYRLGNHPNIPNLLAHFDENGEFLLVQELIEGWTLAEEFASGKLYNEREAIDLLRQILETLSFVHGQNVIHRDIKPSNLIRRASDGRIFLIDFGAVKQVSINPFNQNPTFQSTVAIGSHGYMPPEQTSGKPRFASDLYAAGLVVIEALTGMNPLQLNQSRSTGEFVWLHKTRISNEIGNFISRMVRYDFRQRHLSAKEAFLALNMQAASLGFGRKDPIVVQPVPMPQPIAKPPVREMLQPTVAAMPQLSQTLVQNPQNSFVTKPKRESKGFLSSIWHNDFALVSVIVVIVLGFSSVLGYTVVRYATAQKKPQPEIPNTVSATQMEGTSSSKVFEEAKNQANEAEAKEKRATTKYEWDEIGNQYKRAYNLLTSIASTSSDYASAQEKMQEYEGRSVAAFRRSSEIASNPAAANYSSSSTYPTSNYQTQQTTTTSSAPNKRARMPGKRREKMYISYSSSSGDYIGAGQDRSFTENDGNFSARVSNNQITINFNGGPDRWSLDLAGPQNMKLTPGSYGGAQRAAFHSPTRPGLDFSGSGRGCNNLSGSFNINNILFSSDGKTLLLLDATFVQNCEEVSPPLMGRVYYDGRYY